MGNELVKVVGNGPDVLGDAPFVIVENADEAASRLGDVIERFEGDAVRQRRITENGHDVFIAAELIAGRADSQRGLQGRAGVRRAIAIVLALAPHGKTADSFRAANRVETVFAPGQQFVNITLVTDIPDELIFGSAKDVMEGEGQLDHAEVGPEVAAVFRQDRDQFLANFFGQRLQLVQRQFLDMNRTVHHLKISAHRKNRGNGGMGLTPIVRSLAAA